MIRAFGAPARFLVTQIQRVDQNLSFFFYLWSTNRWISVRYSLLSAFLVGVTAVILLVAVKNINASIAGFALTFALNITSDMLYLVVRLLHYVLSCADLHAAQVYGVRAYDGWRRAYQRVSLLLLASHSWRSDAGEQILRDCARTTRDY